MEKKTDVNTGGKMLDPNPVEELGHQLWGSEFFCDAAWNPKTG